MNKQMQVHCLNARIDEVTRLNDLLDGSSDALDLREKLQERVHRLEAENNTLAVVLPARTRPATTLGRGDRYRPEHQLSRPV